MIRGLSHRRTGGTVAYGEAELFIRSKDVHTDGSGDANFPGSFADASSTTDVTATASSSTTNTAGGTSEFSPCALVGWT
ncbi:MAG TPA: hypothetical protein VG815_07475 [Chloroflexota bacterium]|jgi:hypothetical protein|nr:hypothetical protein [Chloroflexota bacterium]